jgi:hypothetical protein
MIRLSIGSGSCRSFSSPKGQGLGRASRQSEMHSERSVMKSWSSRSTSAPLESFTLRSGSRMTDASDTTH